MTDLKPIHLRTSLLQEPEVYGRLPRRYIYDAWDGEKFVFKPGVVYIYPSMAGDYECGMIQGHEPNPILYSKQVKP